MLRSFVVRCTVASVAFSPTGLTFKIAQLCMNGKQYPLPSGPGVTYFIFKGCGAQSDPLCNYDLLKMIPNYQRICGLVSGFQTQSRCSASCTAGLPMGGRCVNKDPPFFDRSTLQINYTRSAAAVASSSQRGEHLWKPCSSPAFLSLSLSPEISGF